MESVSMVARRNTGFVADAAEEGAIVDDGLERGLTRIMEAIIVDRKALLVDNNDGRQGPTAGSK